MEGNTAVPADPDAHRIEADREVGHGFPRQAVHDAPGDAAGRLHAHLELGGALAGRGHVHLLAQVPVGQEAEPQPLVGQVVEGEASRAIGVARRRGVVDRAVVRVDPGARERAAVLVEHRAGEAAARGELEGPDVELVALPDHQLVVERREAREAHGDLVLAGWSV